MNQPLRCDLGPADLARLLHCDSGLSREDVLSLLNYSEPESKIESHADQEGQPQNPSKTATSAQQKEVVNQPIIGGYRPKFWQVLSLTDKQKPPSKPQPQSIPQGTPQFEKKSGVEVAGPISQLLPYLLSDQAFWSLASCAANCATDFHKQRIQQWIQALSRAHIPKKTVPEQAVDESGEIWLVMDYHPKLMLWWSELRRVSDFLLRYFGRSRARVIPLLSGDLSELCINGDLPWPGQDTRILVFSDVSLYSANLQLRSEWLMVLQRWEGVGARTTLFLPYSRPPAELRQFMGYRTEFWGYGSQVDDGEVVENLLASLSMVQWCSPALLRVWCRMLHGCVEHEFLLWHHPQVWSQPDACGIEGEMVGHYRDRFKEIEPALQQRLLGAVFQCRQFVSREVEMEEVLIRHSLGLSVEPDALAAIRHLTVKLSAQSEMSLAMSRWLWRLSDRQCKQFWENNPQLEQLCISSRDQLTKRAHNKAVIPLGPGMSVTEVQSGSDAEVLSVRAVNKGLIMSVNNTSGTALRGAELVQIKSNIGGLQLSLSKSGKGRSGKWGINQTLPLNGSKFERLELESDLQKVFLRQVEKPNWADSIEQGFDGLFCTLPSGRRLRWCYPGEPFKGAMHPLSAPKNTVKAAWVDEDQWLAFQSGELPYLPEGTKVGKDQYGCFSDLLVGNETQRMRWIPAGEFWMGSPEDESERGDDETRHKVILTQGYWLAETACTQALWKAVMGENPGHFKGGDLPVERVRWGDVQDFCKKLNQKLPELQTRLPSEAEWEYACRAGTETPFWWGSELSQSLANYNDSRPYNNGSKEKYRGKTVSVKSFKSNPWGLYQMHGNVWEWCEDWYGKYSIGAEVSIDPVGVDSGAIRVRRGGSWFFFGKRLRSAYRYHYQPVNSIYFLGFRLAAGPRLGGVEKPELDNVSTVSGALVSAPASMSGSIEIIPNFHQLK